MIIKRLLLITALLSILVRTEAASETASKYFFKSAKSVLYVSPPSATASADTSDQIAGIFVSSDWSAGESDDKVNASNDKKPNSSEDIGQMIPDETEENGENSDKNGDDDEDDGSDGNQDVSSNDLSKIPHNALIISRFGSDHALHTEISVGNIVEADVDAFHAKEGEKADTIFISLENENGTVEMFRIGLDEEIDEVVFLKGAVSADLKSSDVDYADDAKPPGGHFLPYFIGLDQIKSPVIVIMPDTGSQIYFPDGKALSEQPFKEEYKIEEVRAVRDEIEIRLSKKDK